MGCIWTPGISLPMPDLLGWLFFVHFFLKNFLVELVDPSHFLDSPLQSRLSKTWKFLTFQHSVPAWFIEFEPKKLIHKYWFILQLNSIQNPLKNRHNKYIRKEPSINSCIYIHYLAFVAELYQYLCCIIAAILHIKCLKCIWKHMQYIFLHICVSNMQQKFQTDITQFKVPSTFTCSVWSKPSWAKFSRVNGGSVQALAGFLMCEIKIKKFPAEWSLCQRGVGAECAHETDM